MEEDLLPVLLETKLTLQKLQRELKSVQMDSLIVRIDRQIVRLSHLEEMQCSPALKKTFKSYIENKTTEKNKERMESVVEETSNLSLQGSMVTDVSLNKSNDIANQTKSLLTQRLSKLRNSFIQSLPISPPTSSAPIFLDFFMLVYNFQSRIYQIVSNPISKDFSPDRQVFLDLILPHTNISNAQNKNGNANGKSQKSKGLALTHTNSNDLNSNANPLFVNRLERSESMTNIYRHIHNPNKFFKHMILPNCQEEEIRYLFVFESQECIQFEGEYYVRPTYYCFVSQWFIPRQLFDFIRQLMRKQLDLRISSTQQVEDVSYASILKLSTKWHAAIFKQVSILDTNINKHMDKFQLQMQSKEQYLMESSLEMVLHNNMELVVVVIFYYIFLEQKIVVISTTENKDKISEVLMSALFAIEPMKYVYPIVQASMTKNHVEFSSSPVPMMMGFWGPQDRYLLTRKRIINQINQCNDDNENEIFSVLVDINQSRISVVAQKKASQHQYVINRLASWVKHGKEQSNETNQNKSVAAKLSRFMQKYLLCDQGPELEEDWVTILRKAVKKTQMYEFSETQRSLALLKQ